MSYEWLHFATLGVLATGNNVGIRIRKVRLALLRRVGRPVLSELHLPCDANDSQPRFWVSHFLSLAGFLTRIIPLHVCKIELKTGNMRAVLCCRSPRTDSPPPNVESIKQRATRSSTDRVNPGIDMLPYPSKTAFEDAHALKTIFGDTSLPSRHDTTTTSSDPSNILESVGNHELRKRDKSKREKFRSLSGRVRQRLPGSLRSKKSPTRGTSAIEEVQCPQESKVLTSVKPTIGLEDILASRSVSQGGYDSDARNIDDSIEAHFGEQSNAGAIRVSPEYLAKAVKTLDGSRTQAPTTIHTPNRYSSKSPDRTSLSPAFPRNLLEEGGIRLDKEIRNRRSRTLSSPGKIASPFKSSNSEIIGINRHESPQDALRRLSRSKTEGLAYTPVSTSSPPRLPSFDAEDNWRLSFSAPTRVSSLRQTPDSKVTSAQGSRAQQETPTRSGRKPAQERSLSPVDLSNRVSIISSLDDSLIARISRFCEHEPSANDQGPLAANQIVQLLEQHKDRPNTRSQDEGVATNRAQYAVESGRLSPQSSASVKNAASDPESDSLHLFNMRISQRLGSDSLDPMSASPRLVGSPDVQDRRPSISSMKNPLSFCMPGVAATTHLRNTSRTSAIERHNPQMSLKPQESLSDNASSHYTTPDERAPASPHADPGSKGPQKASLDQQPFSSGPSPLPTTLRSSSLGSRADRLSVNRNSIAQRQRRKRPDIEDDSGSILNTTMTMTPKARLTEKNVPDKAIQGHGSPKESRFVEHFTAQSSQDSLANSQTAEPMNGSPHRARKAESRDANSLRHRQSLSSVARLSSTGWLSRKRSRLGHSNTASRDNVSQMSLSSYGSPLSPAAPKLVPESAADIWERALKSAREERKLGSEQSWVGESEFPQTMPSKGDKKGRPKSKPPNVGLDQDNLSVRGRMSNWHRDRTGSRSPTQTSVPSGLLPKPKKSFGEMLGWKGMETQRDFSSWTRFPSHTRAERNLSAGVTDKVEARDFTPISMSAPQPISRNSETSKSSWRQLYRRKKNKSLTFSKAGAKKAIKKWSPLFQEQSSTARSGRRTSVSIGGAVEYPELELIPGLVSASSLALGGSGDGSSEAFQDSTTALVTKRRSGNLEGQVATLPRTKGGRRFASGTSNRAGTLSPDQYATVPEPSQRLRRHGAGSSGLSRTTKAQSASNVLSEVSGEPGGSATAWSNVYADCLGPTMNASPPRTMIATTNTLHSLTDDYVSLTFSNMDREADSSIGDIRTLDLERKLRSGDLRDSTVDFREKLRKEEESSRQGLMEKVEGISTADSLGLDGSKNEGGKEKGKVEARKSCRHDQD